jgi:uncharacterized ferritin-like protein (DUF455 family)
MVPGRFALAAPDGPAMSEELRSAALRALALPGTDQRCSAVESLHAGMPVDPLMMLAAGPEVPGRPPRPRLVAPELLPRRSIGSRAGRAALLHSLAHIEFNAVGLALDAIWRFAGMPAAYYTDWLGVAREEARHFRLLEQRMAALDCRYGDFDAHDGLWELAQRTAGDVRDRMALIPRRMEARGLDVSPAIRARLAATGDHESAAVLDLILRDEIGHVALGNRWFHWLCVQRGLDPAAADALIAARHGVPHPRGPFNVAARRAAGFTDADLAQLQAVPGAPAIPSPD